jgi:hypothetical protein
MRYAALALWFFACGDDKGMRPGPPTGGSGGAIGSGGAGGMGSGGTGGSAGADAASTTITGSICALTSIDPAQPCLLNGTLHSGSTVSILNTGISAAVDDTTGAFAIDAPDGTSPVTLLLTRVQSTFENAAASVLVPSDANALRTVSLTFEDELLVQTNQISQASGGWAMVYAVSSSGAPQRNVAVQGAPVGQDVWYDVAAGTNQMSNGLTETGPSGLALLNNVPAGTLHFNFAPASGTPVVVDVPIVAGHVTIVRVQVVP